MSNRITNQNDELLTLVKKLKNKSISFSGVPVEYRYHPLIVATERELGIRKSIRKGYDVISNKFFVDEQIGDSYFLRIGDNYSIREDIRTISFDDFSSYFDFLQGNIYENACYYGYRFSQDLIDKYSINVDRLNFIALVDNTTDDFTLEFSKSELLQYEAKENRKNDLLQAIETINECTTYDEFYKQLKSTSVTENISEEFLISNFIFPDKKTAFDFVMEYVNNTRSLDFEEKLCLFYEPQAVLAAYNSTCYAKNTIYKHKKRLNWFISALENGEIKLCHKAYFDKETHFFVFYTYGDDVSNSTSSKVVELKRYFPTFDTFAEFLENDLSDCDLSEAILPDLDLSKYKINDKTNLPVQYNAEITYSLKKFYDRNKAIFVVDQNWNNAQGASVKSYHHAFKNFFDFVYFLKGDLSEADLLFCDGLANINDFTGLNFDNAKLQSKIWDKLGGKYEIAFNSSVGAFPAILQNENETGDILMNVREQYWESSECHDIYYVSDLHLTHRLMNAQCKSADDVVCTIQKIIDTLLSKIKPYELDKNIMLIGGDTSSDFSLFRQFINMLRKTLEEKELRLHVVFVLGNHELWDFSQCTFEEIVTKYKQALAQEGMFLLQNNIIFKHHRNTIGEISTEDLQTLSPKELHNRFKEARVILFGGLAFAGYNEEFNANQQIYRDTINREQEIAETKKFETLYDKVCIALPDKRVVVLTHMPQKDWCADITPHSGFVYVNGHTHRNYFHDDGDYRIYADNQIGYSQVNAYLKSFYIDDDYDVFADYENGVYEISRDQYTKFYAGKNIGITFDRAFHKLFMLKKNGYYMFVLQNIKGKLTLLNGGAIKNLEHKDVNYYFDKMDEVIAYIKSPLDKFTEYQKQISKAIKAIGGSGTIHGSIVDIDFLNHIYVNPLDSTITPYYAYDIVKKKIYPDTKSLLQVNCPNLYDNYLKQLEGGSALILREKKMKGLSKPQLYLDTDIYRASIEIKKMQKLYSNILSTWIEPSLNKLPETNK